MERVPRENELEICPYDNNHIVMHFKMAKHLIACERLHPESSLQACPLNETHRIAPENMNSHLKICPDRKGFEKFKFVESKSIVFENPVPCDDEWSESEDSPSYYPLEHCANKKVILGPVGLPSAGRRKFRKMENERWAKLRQEDNSSTE